MLKKIIVIENGKKVQCDTEQEVVKLLIDENYYELSSKQKKEKMEMKAFANCINNKMEVVEKIHLAEKNIENKFIIQDEKTYVFSLLITNNVTILERIDSNVYTGLLNKEKFEGNYVIVNRFAKELLKKYLINNK